MKLEGVAMVRSLEERRKSSLDHHWAVPSKGRSLEEQSASTPHNQGLSGNTLQPVVTRHYIHYAYVNLKI